MSLRININARGNISKLSKSRLIDLLDMLDDPDTILPREELQAIGEELLEYDNSVMNGPQIERFVYWLRENKPVKLREIQNVFLDYVTRAKDGKKNGGKRTNTRKSQSKKRHNTMRRRTDCHR